MIIDDDESHWGMLDKILEFYKISHYPSDSAQFQDVKKILLDFGSDIEEAKKSVQALSGKMPEIKYIFLDINLFDKLNKHSGIRLKNEVLENIFKNAVYIFYTRYNLDDIKLLEGYKGDEEFIQKHTDPAILQRRIKDSFVSEYFKDRLNYSPKTSGWALFQTKSENVFEPRIKFTLHVLISLFLFGALVAVTIVSAVRILPSIAKEHSVIKIIEQGFLLVLPTFIIFGFFVLYQRSLKQYLTSDNKEKYNVDWENASNFIELTKKLFISSLVSYLLITLIEIVNPGHVGVDLKNSDYVRIGVLGGIVIILIVYYFLISWHRRRNDKSET